MWDAFWVVWLSNILWLVCLTPIITFPLAFSGLYVCTHDVVYGESITWKTFFVGIRKYLFPSLRWAGVNLLVFATLVFYVWFLNASGKQGALGVLLNAMPVTIMILWMALNMYTFPFMLVQEKPSYVSALRNSLILFLKWPGQALGFTLFNLLIIALSVWLRFPWIILGGSLPALLACICVKDVAEQVGGAET